MKWFRLYDEIIDDPKVMLLEEKYRWRYVAILACINRYERHLTKNRLPNDSKLTFSLRLSQAEVDDTIEKLLTVNLLQKDKHGYYCKAFTNRQFDSDDVTARVKRYRNVARNVDVTPDETPPETEAETDTEDMAAEPQNGKPIPPKDSLPWNILQYYKQAYEYYFKEECLIGNEKKALRQFKDAWNKSGLLLYELINEFFDTEIHKSSYIWTSSPRLLDVFIKHLPAIEQYRREFSCLT